jgi:ADP-dependent NAD(P)H-hydrate dehydratase
MAVPVTEVTPARLRAWPLPSGGNSKYSRGRVLVVGGAAKTPGAVQLAGLAALRVGAGHLSIAVAESAAVPLAVAMPEAGVTGLPQDDAGSVLGTDVGPIASDLASADAVLVGPGLDHAQHTRELLGRILPELGRQTWLVLDAFALGALAERAEPLGRDRVVLTPNENEAELLLERPMMDLEQDAAEIARRYGSLVCCRGLIADPGGDRWRVGSGHGGLATSGSGDVLAGALVGLLARGATGAQAACWGAYVHAAAGDRLAARVGRLGFLAREILDQLPAVLVELES